MRSRPRLASSRRVVGAGEARGGEQGRGGSPSPARFAPKILTGGLVKLALVTVAVDPESRSFPDDPLSASSGEILSIVEHFFYHDGLPHLLLVVHHRTPAEGGPRRASALRDEGPRAELSEAERPLYDRLRVWRNGRARADAVPPYVLLTNRQLADIARMRPGSLAALASINGIGEAKSGKLGADLLAVVAGVADGG